MLGFTPAKKGRPVRIPEGRIWYVRPIGNLSTATLAKLVQTVRTQEIPGIDLSDHWDISNESLAEFRHVPSLQWLDISRTRVSDTGLASIASLRNLRVLILPQGISDAGLSNLSPLGQLEELNLDRTSVTDQGLEVLVRFRNLQRLDLSGSRVTDHGLTVLAHLPHLKRLILNGGMTDAAAPALRRLRSLKELDISQTDIVGEGLAAVAQLPELTTLYLNKRVGDKGIQQLSGSRSLRTLDLSGTAITDFAVESLSKISTLQELALSQTAVGNQSLAYLARLPNLKMLELSDTHIESSGLAPLAKLKGLEIISLSWQKLTRDDLQGMSKLRQLKTIILNGVPLPEVTMAQLRRLNEVSPWEQVQGFERAQLKEPVAERPVALASPVIVPVAPSVYTGPLPEGPRQSLKHARSQSASAWIPRVPSPNPTAAVGSQVSKTNTLARIPLPSKDVPGGENLRPERLSPDRTTRKEETAFLSIPASLKDQSPGSRGVKSRESLSAGTVPELQTPDRPASARHSRREDPDVLVKAIVLQSNPTRGGGFSGLSGMKQLSQMSGPEVLRDVTAATEKPGITVQEDRPENYLGEINVNAAR